MAPLVGLSLERELDLLGAALPLLEAGEVEVLEWSFDTAWSEPPPDWYRELLDRYAAEDRLLGHGVSFSLLSGELGPRHRAWLDMLREECARRRYRHLSEHFGFMTAGDFHRGAPLPVPCTAETLALGQARIELLREASGRPVGLENLAFAFSSRDVAEQGQFLDRLLAPSDGFVLLDLHNLYCQVENFGVPPLELLESYPLERVRELHCAGGSWSDGPDGARIRRDTHDGDLPEGVFELLELALPRCPAVEAVILERLGGTLSDDPAAAERWRADFRAVAATVARVTG